MHQAESIRQSGKTTHIRSSKIIGLPGEVVMVEELYINGKNWRSLISLRNADPSIDSTSKIRKENTSCWAITVIRVGIVMLGFCAEENFIGRALAVLAPNRIGTLNKISLLFWEHPSCFRSLPEE